MQIKKLSNVIVKEVDHIPNPHEAKREGASWIGSGYTKLYIWSLTDYDKVILDPKFDFIQVFYIDADCMIKSNPEDVFQRDVDFAAVPDIFPPDHFNAGVLLIVN